MKIARVKKNVLSDMDVLPPPKWDWKSAREHAINKWNETAKHYTYPDSKAHE